MRSMQEMPDIATDDSCQPGVPGIFLSATQLAQVFGVSVETVLRRLRETGVQPQRSGRNVRYDLRSAVRILAEYLLPVGKGLDHLSPLQRRLHWQARESEIRVRKSLGELVDVAHARHLANRLALLFVQMTELLPDRMERDLGIAPAQSTVVDDYMRRFRDEVAVAIEEMNIEFPEPLL